MSYRRLLPFLLLNIFVSAVVVLAILYWWGSGTGEDPSTPLGDPNAPAVGFQPATNTPPAAGELSVTAEPTATATPDINRYVVQSGDTLGQISEIFGVTIDDIVEANGLLNPNQLQVEQELIIPPPGGFPEPTAVPTNTPESVAPTPIPTVPLAQGEANIEIQEVIGWGDLTTEAVSIVNTGSQPLALRGWTLQDEDGFVYTFGEATIFGDGAGILVHTEAGPPATPSDLHWGLEEPVWQPGETARLFDAEGTEQSSRQVPAEEITE